jgi:hypothetical protein
VVAVVEVMSLGVRVVLVAVELAALTSLLAMEQLTLVVAVVVVMTAVVQADQVAQDSSYFVTQKITQSQSVLV